MISNGTILFLERESHKAPEGSQRERLVNRYGNARVCPAKSQQSGHETPYGQCQCGCGKWLDSPGRGTPRKYNNRACRTRAWRRRKARKHVQPVPASDNGRPSRGIWLKLRSKLRNRIFGGRVTSPRPVRPGR